MASDRTLCIPAMMWLSLSCGTTLLSATDLSTSLQSFPSSAPTTAGHTRDPRNSQLLVIFSETV